MWSRLSFKELLLVAEFFLDTPFDELERTICRPLAEAALEAPFVQVDDLELYPDSVEKAAVCCLEIIRFRPLPFGNEKVGYECMREMLSRAAHPWGSEDAGETIGNLNQVEARTISDGEFVRWARARVGLAEWLRYQGKPMT